MTSDLPANLRPYLDIMYATLEEFSDTSLAVRDAMPLDTIAALAVTGRSPAEGRVGSSKTLEALFDVGRSAGLPEAMAAADTHFETPANFNEALYFAWWLRRAPDEAIAIREARYYVESASVPDRLADLVVDRGAVLETTRFTVLWRKPGDIGAVLGTLATWRDKFTMAYIRAHSIYHRELSTVVDAIDDLSPRAMAVERLNALRRLGSSVASAALDQYHELEHLYACPISTEVLSEALREAPICPECRFEMGSQAPTTDARRVRQAVERGLVAQQRRLAQRVVSRLLEQPSRSEGERLERFVQVVQASDLGGLAIVLDETIIDFLRDFLEPAPAALEANLIERLSASFPEITLANLDAAVAEVRRLLTSDVVASGGLLRLVETGQDG